MHSQLVATRFCTTRSSSHWYYIFPNVLSMVTYEVTKVRIGSHWPQNRKNWVCSSIQVQTEDVNSVCSCTQSSQFTSLLAGVIGDKKLLLAYDIRSQSSLSPFSLFSAGSSLVTEPNTNTLMSIHAMYDHYVSSLTGIIPPWRTLLNLKWCGWIRGHSKIGDGH